MFTATANFQTPNASKYLQQLCKHFSHKLEVSFTDSVGRIALPTGPASLEASADRLQITVGADGAEALDRAKHIVDKHLVKFAFRENVEGLNWK